MDAFCSCVVTYIIDLLMHAYSRLAIRLLCLCFTSEKTSLSLFSPFLTVSFIYMRRNPVRRMTGIKDAYQTLTAIPFKVGVKHSSKFFAIVSIKKHFAEFSFLYIFNSLVYGKC